MTTTQPPRRVQKLSGGFTVTTFPIPPRELHLVDATDIELAHFGLPPRPDRKLEESLYVRWYRTFERPMSFLIPNFEELWEVRHLPRTRSIVNEELSTNWSGVAVYAQKGDSINRAVAAEWVVPTPKNVDGGDDYCSIWIGIDGDPSQDPAGANNLLQAGIEAKVDASGIPVCYAWWEWLSMKYRVPEVSIPNFRLVPGDYVETQIWVTSDTTANVCMFSSNDASALTTTLFSISAPPGDQVLGSSAEWIVERPSVSGVATTLDNYGTVEFSSAMCWTASGQTAFAGSGTIITMVDDSGTVLSKARVVSPEIVTCSYV